jgi:anti-sigma28 factor (negative regulator of flagellin synthesis)
MTWKRYLVFSFAALLAGGAGGVLITAWVGGKQVSREGAATLVVGIAAAMLVAWQSWETRKSAQAGAAAVATANAALKLTQSALDVAQKEERHTRQLIIETIKARIDAGTYPLTVTVDPSAVWPPLEPSISGGAPNPLPTNMVYRLPKDADNRIIVRARFDIRNQGSDLVTVKFNDPWVGSDGIGGEQPVKAGAMSLASGRRLDGYFEVDRSVAEWAEIAQYRLTGQVIEDSVRAITLDDESDTGAIDWYEIVIGGTPLIAIDDEQGGWRISPGQYLDFEKNAPVMGVVAHPRKRVYYLSKRKTLLLDEASGPAVP